MAAFRTHFVSRTFSLVNLCTRRSLSSKNNYFRKYKHRRNRKISDLDIEQLLYNRTTRLGDEAGALDGAVISADSSSAAGTIKETNYGTWYYSKERLKSLKKNEKIVAVIAVAMMLFGYFGIKWMASAPPTNTTVEKTELESTETGEQLAAT